MFPGSPGCKAKHTSFVAGTRAVKGAGRRWRYPLWVLGAAPYFAGRVDAQLELGLLLLDGEVVAVVRAREAALRREAKVLHRHVLGRGVDAPLERVLRFELGQLGAHQTEHHLLALGHQAQRLEAAGALVVVLEEEAVDVQAGEHALGDEVGVTAARQPGALEVAAAGGGPDRHVVVPVLERPGPSARAT